MSVDTLKDLIIGGVKQIVYTKLRPSSAEEDGPRCKDQALEAPIRQIQATEEEVNDYWIS